MKNIVVLVILLMFIASMCFAQEFTKAENRLSKADRQTVREEKILYTKTGEEIVVNSADYNIGGIYAQIKGCEEEIRKLKDPNEVQKKITSLEKEKARWEAMKVKFEE